MTGSKRTIVGLEEYLMIICDVAPVSKAPEVTLQNWRIFDIGTEKFIFFGRDISSKRWRASSPITTFDLERMIGVTQSGRVYRLSGLLGFPDDGAQETFEFFCLAAGISCARDVTGEFESGKKWQNRGLH